MKTETEKLADNYIKAQDKLMGALAELPNGKDGGTECDCEEPNGIDIPEEMQSIRYCLNCGGFITP